MWKVCGYIQNDKRKDDVILVYRATLFLTGFLKNVFIHIEGWGITQKSLNISYIVEIDYNISKIDSHMAATVHNLTGRSGGSTQVG